jgi:hypothetical protein
VEKRVLVIWSAGEPCRVALPLGPLQIFDHLGRELPRASRAFEVTEAPLIAVLPADGPARFELDPPRANPAWAPGDPSPVVLQLVRPQEQTAWRQSAYRVAGDAESRLTLYAYNFGPAPAEGRLSVSVPEGWRAGLAGELAVSPGDRIPLELSVRPVEAPAPGPLTFGVSGDFGTAGRCLLSFRVVAERTTP